MNYDPFNTLQLFTRNAGQSAKLYSLPALKSAGVDIISHLPVSIRLVLESVLRNGDDQKLKERVSPSDGALDDDRPFCLNGAG